MGYGIVAECLSLRNLTVPYIGSTQAQNETFGYFFATENIYCGNNYQLAVEVTNEDILVEGAFSNFNDITSIKLNGNITDLPCRVFANCYALTSVEYPNSVRVIGEAAFAGDFNLPSISINQNVLYIEDSAFSGCNALKTVTIRSALKTIGCRAFEYCSSLTELSLPYSLTSIDDYAFEYCYSLKAVYFPYTLETIGDYCFNNCSALTKVELVYPLKTIGEYAFNGCSALTYVLLPNTLQQLGRGAFYNCSKLAEVNINSSSTIEKIEQETFNNCYSLKEIKIPSRVKTIEDRAFTNCSALESLELGYVNEIGSWAFANCTSLKEVKLPTTINTINPYAFYNAAALEAVYLRSDAQIGSDAFYECKNLHEVYDLSGYQKVTKGGYDNGMLGYYAVIIRTSSSAPRLTEYKTEQARYKYDNTFCALVEYYGNDRKLVLDKVTINNKKYAYVIAPFAFDWASVEELIFTNAVVGIGHDAFTSSYSLSTVKFEGSTLDLRENTSMFRYVTYVVVDSSLRGLDSYAFYNIGTLLYSESQSSWDSSRYTNNFFTEPDYYYSACFHNWNDRNWNYDMNGYFNFYAQGYDIKDWVDPTCTEDGSYVEYCNVCGYNNTIVLEKTGHDFYYNYYFHCNVCNEINPFRFDYDTQWRTSFVISYENDNKNPFTMFDEVIDEIKSNKINQNESAEITFYVEADINIKLNVTLKTFEENSATVIVNINGKEHKVIDESGISQLEFNLKQGDSITFIFARGDVEDEECYMAINDIQIS